MSADERVQACWLEGADALDAIDGYSDIDFCAAVTQGSIEAVAQLARDALGELGRLDVDHVVLREPDRQHVVLHVDGTPAELLVDLSLNVNRGTSFIEDDPIERPLVLFDRGNVIKFIPQSHQMELLDLPTRLEFLRLTIAQHGRVLKHVRRGQFLEAVGYYHRWVIEPLVEVQRMLYTPLHTDYYVVHISRHLPAATVARLERLVRVVSLSDLELKVAEAVTWFHETASHVEGKQRTPG
jgi:hypothetical protein